MKKNRQRKEKIVRQVFLCWILTMYKKKKEIEEEVIVENKSLDILRKKNRKRKEKIVKQVFLCWIVTMYKKKE